MVPKTKKIHCTAFPSRDGEKRNNYKTGTPKFPAYLFSYIHGNGNSLKTFFIPAKNSARISMPVAPDSLEVSRGFYQVPGTLRIPPHAPPPSNSSPRGRENVHADPVPISDSPPIRWRGSPR